MRAARFHGIGDLRVETIADPAPPGRGQVRMAVKAAGICGSDIHNFRHGKWIAHLPVTPGHELCGLVTAVGAGVEGLAVGDLVVADSRVACGACARCRAGRANLCASLGFVGEVCDGGFAQEAVLPARGLHVVPAGVPPAAAAMAEPLAVALHAVGRLAPRPDEPVLVTGAGPIGALCAVLLARQPGRRVLLADRRRDRLEQVAALTGAVPVALAGGADGVGEPPSAAIDATGSAAVLDRLVGLMAPGSRLALVGIFHGSLALDPNLLVEREVDLVGCSAFAGELPAAVALLPELASRLAALATPAHPLGELPRLYAEHAAGAARGIKTIIAP